MPSSNWTGCSPKGPPLSLALLPLLCTNAPSTCVKDSLIGALILPLALVELAREAAFLKTLLLTDGARDALGFITEGEYLMLIEADVTVDIREGGVGASRIGVYARGTRLGDTPG